MMYQYNIDNTQVQIPTPITWTDVVAGNKWDLKQVMQPKPIIQTRPTIMIEENQGNVHIEFSPTKRNNLRITPGRFSLDSRTENPFRASSRLREVDFQPNIPNPMYTPMARKEEDMSPSPTMFGITPPSESACLLVITSEEPFQIDKNYLRKELKSKKNNKKCYWFFKNLTDEQIAKFRSSWYEYMEQDMIIVPMFTYFEKYAPKNDIEYPWMEVNVNWKTTLKKEIQSNHPNHPNHPV